MVRPCATAVVLFAVASMGAGAAGSGAGQAAIGHEGRRDVALRDLAAVRRLMAPLARRDRNTPDSERAAAWTDVWQISEAVLGRPLDSDITFADLIEKRQGYGGPRVAATPGVARRDATAYQLLGIGYSARETADIISGRISIEALDMARRMRAAGMGREQAADYLDREYRRLAELRLPGPAVDDHTLTRSSAFAHSSRSTHACTASALISSAPSSTPNPRIRRLRARAGAIGLMQLMPATARELGVDPYAPEQNIEGGIRYFSGLLQSFGGIELALVAYNGGPGYARRYARGDAVLYGETRAYVRRVLAALTDARH